MWVKWWDHSKFQPFQSRWVFVWNHSYFKGDVPACTRTASSFCPNLVNFCTHAMWVKCWYHAKFQPFQSRWVFVRNLSYIKGDGPVCTRSASSFYRNLSTFVHMLCGWNDDTVPSFNLLRVDEFSSKTPHTSKEMVQLVNEVHPVFVVTLSTFVHMLCGWNDDTMPSFNLFRVDEFSSETPHTSERWSSLYTKCIQFLS